MNKRTASFFRIDEKVFFTMAGICLVSIGVLAFRFATRKECKQLHFNIKAEQLMEDHLIHFKASSQDGKKFYWDFGDGSPVEKGTSATTHIYKEPGVYTVTLEVDGSCTEVQKLYVQEAPVIIDKSMLPVIVVAKDTAYVDKTVHFNDASPNSSSWEWQFGETGRVDAKERTTQYTFKSPGEKYVLLKVNNRPDLIAYKTILVLNNTSTEVPETNAATRPAAKGKAPNVIYVNPQPTEKPMDKGDKTDTQSPPPAAEEKKEEPKPKAPVLTGEQAASMLWEVADGKKTAQDFSEYLCNNLAIEIVYNGKSMPFNQLCTELKNIKKKNIKKIEAVTHRYANTNCTVKMNVTVKQKTFLQKIF